MKRFLALLLALAMVLSLAACGAKTADAPAATEAAKADAPAAAPAAAEQDPVTIQITYPPSANGTTDLEMQWVRDKVLEATDGKVTFELYPGSSLASDKVALDSIMTGTLDGAAITANSLAQTIPEMNTRCLPYCFEDADHYWRVMLDPEYRASVQGIFDKYDIVFLGTPGAAMRGIASTKEIHTPADVNGMKCRIMDGTIYQDLYTQWGFGTSTIAFGEVYTAIQQGVVDGCDIDMTALNFMAIGEVSPYYLETNQIFHGMFAVVSKDVWSRVTPENQQKILDIFVEMESGITQEIFADFYQKSLEKVEAWGCKVSYVNDEEFAAWKDASLPIYEKYKPIIGEEYYNEFMAFVDKHR